MKSFRVLPLIFALAILSLLGCRQAESPAPAGQAANALIDGSKELDGTVTANLADGADLVDAKDSSLHYVSSGPGHFEVKSAPAWTNITTSTTALTTAGADKILKLDLALTGVKKQYEVTYAFDTPPGLKASTWTTKLFVPAVYATAGLTAYPTIALYVKTGANWTGKKVAEFNTLNLGAGWKTIAINFATSKLTVDGVDKTAATEFAASFADVATSFGEAPGVTLSFYGDGLDAGLTGPFYLDYLNVSGIALAQVADPSLSTAANAVTMTTATTGADIWYTTDGSTPAKDGANSTKYAASVAITANTTFKALAVKTGMADSSVTTYNAVFTAGPDASADPAGTTFTFGSAVTEADDSDPFKDDGSDYGASGSRFIQAAEASGAADGVLVIKGAATKPVTAQTTLFTLSLPAAVASPASISFKIKVPAGMAGDWWQALDVAARLGSGWTWTQTKASIKFPDSAQSVGAFTADTWKTITLPASAFSGDSLADLRAVTFKVYRNFAADNAQATSLDDITIDWVNITTADTSADPAGSTFTFGSAVTEADDSDSFKDDGSDYGASGSRFIQAAEASGAADGVLVIKGAATKPVAAQTTLFTLTLPAAVASPASISFKIKVPAGMAGDWWQALDVAARLGSGWTWTQTKASIKFPDSAQSVGSFTADTWKTITLAASAFTGDSLADLRAVTFKVYRNFAADNTQATSLDDITIDWISVQ